MRNTIIAIVGAVLIIWLALAYSSGRSTNPQVSDRNVYLENGKQVVEILAKGGYSPQVSTASSSVPTILRIKTEGTFDCSSFVVIPSKNISKTLPQSGATDIDLGTPSSGTIDGTCSMGMYRFAINFK